MINLYQVGGSLAVDAPTYISRQTDRELFTYLEQGDFCYVFNSRQMGKSSLLIHTKQILQAKGWQTANLDMTMLGSELIIDEIDSILSLNFPTDDFFAFIRFCYNQRANNPIYQRMWQCRPNKNNYVQISIMPLLFNLVKSNKACMAGIK